MRSTRLNRPVYDWEAWAEGQGALGGLTETLGRTNKGRKGKAIFNLLTQTDIFWKNYLPYRKKVVSLHRKNQ